MVWKITIMGKTPPKPRMTRRDKWAQRPQVMAYRAWKDLVRAKANLAGVPDSAIALDWEAFLPIPKSWPKKKRLQMAGKPHRSTPDRDNIDKGVMDALFKQDSMVAFGQQVKRWDDGHGPRIVIRIYSEQGAM